MIVYDIVLYYIVLLKFYFIDFSSLYLKVAI